MKITKKRLKMLIESYLNEQQSDYLGKNLDDKITSLSKYLTDLNLTQSQYDAGVLAFAEAFDKLCDILKLVYPKLEEIADYENDIRGLIMQGKSTATSARSFSTSDTLPEIENIIKKLESAENYLNQGVLAIKEFVGKLNTSGMLDLFLSTGVIDSTKVVKDNLQKLILSTDPEDRDMALFAIKHAPFILEKIENIYKKYTEGVDKTKRISDESSDPKERLNAIKHAFSFFYDCLEFSQEMTELTLETGYPGGSFEFVNKPIKPHENIIFSFFYFTVTCFKDAIDLPGNVFQKIISSFQKPKAWSSEPWDDYEAF
jgi:hypothetical protein